MGPCRVHTVGSFSWATGVCCGQAVARGQCGLLLACAASWGPEQSGRRAPGGPRSPSWLPRQPGPSRRCSPWTPGRLLSTWLTALRSGCVLVDETVWRLLDSSVTSRGPSYIYLDLSGARPVFSGVDSRVGGRLRRGSSSALAALGLCVGPGPPAWPPSLWPGASKLSICLTAESRGAPCSPCGPAQCTPRVSSLFPWLHPSSRAAPLCHLCVLAQTFCNVLAASAGSCSAPLRSQAKSLLLGPGLPLALTTV